MNKTKIFSGETFSYYDSYTTKKECNLYANRLRNNNYNVRMIQKDKLVFSYILYIKEKSDLNDD